MREESEYSAGSSVRPWNAPCTAMRLTRLPAWRAPGSVISLVLVSAMRPASDTDSEPEFRVRKRAYGQPPRLWPISARRARVTRSCDRLGDMMLAITCGLAMAANTDSGVWPKPSMP